MPVGLGTVWILDGLEVTIVGRTTAMKASRSTGFVTSAFACGS